MGGGEHSKAMVGFPEGRSVLFAQVFNTAITLQKLTPHGHSDVRHPEIYQRELGTNSPPALKTPRPILSGSFQCHQDNRMAFELEGRGQKDCLQTNRQTRDS